MGIAPTLTILPGEWACEVWLQLANERLDHIGQLISRCMIVVLGPGWGYLGNDNRLASRDVALFVVLVAKPSEGMCAIKIQQGVIRTWLRRITFEA